MFIFMTDKSSACVCACACVCVYVCLFVCSAVCIICTVCVFNAYSIFTYMYILDHVFSSDLNKTCTRPSGTSLLCSCVSDVCFKKNVLVVFLQSHSKTEILNQNGKVTKIPPFLTLLTSPIKHK